MQIEYAIITQNIHKRVDCKSMSKHRYPVHAPEWLEEIAKKRGEKAIIPLQTAIDLYDTNKNPMLEKGLGIADILLSLSLDNETLASAIVYPALQAHEIDVDAIMENLGERSSKLLNDVMQMQSLGKLRHYQQRGNHQLENLRKMLLAMVTDVRAVLIVLAERLWQLRQAKNNDKTEQLQLAQDTQAVFAPLANRLGVWQIKWEIEDLCLRYTQPDEYMRIAKGIAARRDDREMYIREFIALTIDALKQANISKFEVSGRVKHIYSIYNKMMRKNANLEKIYDMSAIRVMVDSIDECYAVLSVLQNLWPQIQEEFDDYIANPKANGYQSIHTVLIGPHEHNVEVQIRTHKMHQESELGVAAHWRYKEGVLQTGNYEAKIALLRQLMEWQQEVQDKTAQTHTDLFADRIYVFTPLGDIIDLPKGSTPLDFAYMIHSEVGHRCRGAKVDGNIVPLVYQLQTGQRIEILTAKQAHPSRDWLNPHLGYIKSPRTRAKIQHWFREQDHEQSGEFLEKELKRLSSNQKVEDARIHAAEPRKFQPTSRPKVSMVGINNLLTHMARCCKPLPGDAIVGYITRNRGLSVHREDCPNIRYVGKESVHKMMDVNWGENHVGAYAADLIIRMHDRTGALRDITSLLSNEKVNIQGLHVQKVQNSQMEVEVTIEIATKEQLKHVMELLKKIPDVVTARRR